MGAALVYTQELTTETCCNCYMEFAAPASFIRQRRNDKQDFYCPSGHPQRYTGETAEERIKKLQQEKDAALAAQRFTEQRLASERLSHQAEIKRREKRAHAGVCEHCHRTFTNVARHMKSKHSSKGLK